jgi:hypothetical protein
MTFLLQVKQTESIWENRRGIDPIEEGWNASEEGQTCLSLSVTKVHKNAQFWDLV